MSSGECKISEEMPKEKIKHSCFIFLEKRKRSRMENWSKESPERRETHLQTTIMEEYEEVKNAINGGSKKTK